MADEFRFGKRSRKRLAGVHVDLVLVMQAAILSSSIDFTVLEGVRTKKRQRRLYESGASMTMKSRHLTGHAVDIAPLLNGSVRWDWPLYHELAAVVKEAAQRCRIPVEWGGDWTTFRDGPHWQLPRKQYPA